MSANGRMTARELASIGSGYSLRRDAAAAFNAMCAEALHKYGTRVLVRAAYRTLALQWYFWNLYRSGRGNLAAYPGTSNHGWGLAVDLYNQRMRWIVDQIGAKYGFAKRWSDAPGEWWHIKWRGGVWKGHARPLPPLRRGSKGARVKTLQRRLRALGFKSVRVSGYFNLATRSAVKRFQKKHHLKSDGIVGPATTRALKRAVRS